MGQKRLDVAEDIFVVLSGFVAQWHEPHEAGSWRHSSHVISWWSCLAITIWNDLKRFRPFEVREVCSFYVRRMVRLLPAFWLAMAWTGTSGESGRGSWRLHTSNLSAGFQASRQGMPKSSHGSRQSSLIVLRQEPNFTNPVFEMRFAAALVEDRHLVRAKSNAL